MMRYEVQAGVRTGLCAEAPAVGPANLASDRTLRNQVDLGSMTSLSVTVG